jgi:hypothetical protein
MTGAAMAVKGLTCILPAASAARISCRSWSATSARGADQLRDQGNTRQPDNTWFAPSRRCAASNRASSATEYWIGPDVIVAKADKSRFRGFGRNWNLTGRSAEIVKLDWGNQKN